jgi:hypothetical protein
MSAFDSFIRASTLGGDERGKRLPLSTYVGAFGSLTIKYSRVLYRTAFELGVRCKLNLATNPGLKS